MAKIGILAEKNSQATAIAEALGLKKGDGGFFGSYNGREYAIAFARGHLLQLESPNSANPKANWDHPSSLIPLPQEPKIVTSEDKLKDIKKVKKTLSGINEIWNACDPDREGEAIYRDLVQHLGIKAPAKRLWLTAGLDKDSILVAIENLRPISSTDGLYNAQKARSVSDWFYTYVTMGMSAHASRGLMGEHLGKGSGRAGVTSVGRVQTPVLRLVVDRDNSITNYQVVHHFIIKIKLSQDDAVGDFTYKIILTDDQKEFLLGDPSCGFVENDKGNGLLLLDKSKAQAFVDELAVIDGGSISIEVESKDTARNPPRPFSQLDLQRAAGTKLGLSPQDTLDIASKLYLAGYISYPGTDRDMLPLSEFPQAMMILSGLADIRGITTGGISLDELAMSLDTPPACYEENPGEHYALMPTMNIPEPGKLDKNEDAIYQLVCERYIEAHFPAAIIEKYSAVAIFHDVLGPAGEKDPVAMLTASTVKYAGWMAAFSREVESENDLDDEEEHGHADFVDGNAKYECGQILAKETSPPKRYTESSLLADMKGAAKFVESTDDRNSLKDARGLGTARTRGVIIKVLLDRGYLIKKAGKLLSTPKGRGLIEHLDDELSSVVLTAKWEGILNDIEKCIGDDAIQKRKNFIKSQALRLEKHLMLIAEAAESVPLPARAASPKSIKFGKSIATTLGIEFDDSLENDAVALSTFIDANKDAAFSKPKPPTTKALQFAERIAGILNEDLPEELQTDFKACSAYINEKKSLAFPA